MSFIEILKSLFKLSGYKVISSDSRDKISMDWDAIEVLLKAGNPSQLRQALIMADRSLDRALKDLSAGEKQAERMVNARSMFSMEVYQKLWDAHKMRNALVHESGYEPQHFMLKNAVENIRRGLKELGVKV